LALLISRSARHRLQLEKLFPHPVIGKLTLAKPGEAQLLAQTIAEATEPTTTQTPLPSAVELQVLALLEEAFQLLLAHYFDQQKPGLLRAALEVLDSRLGSRALGNLLQSFASEFLDGRSSPEGALAEADRGGVDEERWRRSTLREMIVFWLMNGNPAAAWATRTLHQGSLVGSPEYSRFLLLLADFLSRQPGLDGDEESLLDSLLAPGRAAPDSLAGQLRFIIDGWRHLLGEHASRLETRLDLLAEERPPGVGMGSGPSQVPSYGPADEAEEERYSPDESWMTRLVLLAKNTYVWLYQLSRAYGRPIQRLDQIPDEALETISRRGFSGLWLIGLWERSPASKRIKELCGNPEAVASAYSVKSYSIAGDLGGDEALQSLQERARSYGIRLAADMVPNHMGIDSDWLLDFPDRFVSVATPPFPAYTFDGPDLSPRADVGIVLEDHYYDRSDAAVVFKRTDHGSGESRYVYHGNDGTSMPWNDTAQLDYRRREVREAVIATIVDVARRFPVIRFDAAMTLAKKHYQRLWFPEPGVGDCIPTRAAYAMTREDFDREMPREFWREVVERVASEAPNTLLLAEAFWLMEGYFVRTLGMHRVYNSAFMNMLRDEENAKFRLLVKETLAFDPRILGRYVNFMSNPDERTAVDQFGREDRYFGVCMLMATLPGLPMFAHGQVEGLTEKYGMEYRRAYVQEEADADLVARHEREIAPLLRRRELFAGVDSFLFYDCVGDDGRVNEDVIAFSNASGDERVVVIFNNRYAHAHGHIRGSVPFRVRNGDGSGKHQTRKLVEALALGDEEAFVHFSDSISGLHYLVSSRELVDRGLAFDLDAFEYRVLHGFRELRDDDSHTLARLADRLAGSGVQDMELARREIELEPIRLHLRQALTSARVAELASLSTVDLEAQKPDELLAGLSDELRELANEIAPHGESDPELKGHRERAERRLLALTTLPLLAARLSGSTTPRLEAAGRALGRTLTSTPELAAGLYGWIVVELVRDQWGAVADSTVTYRELDAEAALVSALVAANIDPERAQRTASSLILGLEEGWGQRSHETGAGSATDLMHTLLDRRRAREIVGVHSVRDQEWIHKESLEGILVWRWVLEILAWSSATERRARDLPAAIADWWEIVVGLNRMAEEAGYRIDRRRLDTLSD